MGSPSQPAPPADSVEYIRALTADAISKLANSTIAAWSYAQVRALSEAQMSYFSKEQIHHGFSTTQFGWINACRMASISNSAIPSIQVEKIRVLVPEQLCYFYSTQMPLFTRDQVAAMSSQQLLGFASPASAAPYNMEMLNYLSDGAINVLTDIQLVGLGTRVASLNGSFLNKLAYWVNVVAANQNKYDIYANYAIAGLSTLQIQSLSLSALSELACSHTQQLTPHQLSAFSGAQIASMKYITMVGKMPYWNGPASPMGYILHNGTSISTGTDTRFFADYVTALTATQVSYISTAAWGLADAVFLNALTTSAFTAIPPQAFSSIPTTAIAGLTDFSVGLLTSTQAQTMDLTVLGSKIANLQSSAVASLSVQKLSSLTSTQIAGLPASFLNKISDIQFSTLGSSFLTLLSTNSLKGLSLQKLRLLTASQLNALSGNQISNLPATFFNNLSDTAFAGLNSAQFALLGSAAIGGLERDRIQLLSANKLNALSILQISVLPYVGRISATVWEQLTNPVKSYLITNWNQHVANMPMLSSIFNVLNLTAVNNISNPLLATIAAADFGNIDAVHLAYMSTRQFSAISAEQFQNISTSVMTQLQRINRIVIGVGNSSERNNTLTALLRALPESVYQSMTLEQITWLAQSDREDLLLLLDYDRLQWTRQSVVNLVNLGLLNVPLPAGMTPEQLFGNSSTRIAFNWSWITAAYLNGLHAESFAEIAASSSLQPNWGISGLSTTCLSGLSSTTVSWFSINQFNALSETQLGSLDNFSGMNSTVMSALTINRLQALNFTRVNSDFIQRMGAEQWNWVSAHQIQQIPLAILNDAQAFTASRIAALSTTQLQALTITANLRASFFTSLTAQQWANLTTAQWAALSLAQIRSGTNINWTLIDIAQLNALSPTIFTSAIVASDLPLNQRPLWLIAQGLLNQTVAWANHQSSALLDQLTPALMNTLATALDAWSIADFNLWLASTLGYSGVSAASVTPPLGSLRFDSATTEVRLSATPDKLQVFSVRDLSNLRQNIGSANFVQWLVVAEKLRQTQGATDASTLALMLQSADASLLKMDTAPLLLNALRQANVAQNNALTQAEFSSEQQQGLRQWLAQTANAVQVAAPQANQTVDTSMMALVNAIQGFLNQHAGALADDEFVADVLNPSDRSTQAASRTVAVDALRQRLTDLMDSLLTAGGIQPGSNTALAFHQIKTDILTLVDLGNQTVAQASGQTDERQGATIQEKIDVIQGQLQARLQAWAAGLGGVPENLSSLQTAQAAAAIARDMQYGNALDEAIAQWQPKMPIINVNNPVSDFVFWVNKYSNYVGMSSQEVMRNLLWDDTNETETNLPPSLTTHAFIHRSFARYLEERRQIDRLDDEIVSTVFEQSEGSSTVPETAPVTDGSTVSRYETRGPLNAKMNAIQQQMFRDLWKGKIGRDPISGDLILKTEMLTSDFVNIVLESLNQVLKNSLSADGTTINISSENRIKVKQLSDYLKINPPGDGDLSKLTRTAYMTWMALLQNQAHIISNTQSTTTEWRLWTQSIAPMSSRQSTAYAKVYTADELFVSGMRIGRIRALLQDRPELSQHERIGRENLFSLVEFDQSNLNRRYIVINDGNMSGRMIGLLTYTIENTRTGKMVSWDMDIGAVEHPTIPGVSPTALYATAIQAMVEKEGKTATYLALSDSQTTGSYAKEYIELNGFRPYDRYTTTNPMDQLFSTLSASPDISQNIQHFNAAVGDNGILNIAQAYQKFLQSTGKFSESIFNSDGWNLTYRSVDPMNLDMSSLLVRAALVAGITGLTSRPLDYQNALTSFYEDRFKLFQNSDTSDLSVYLTLKELSGVAVIDSNGQSRLLINEVIKNSGNREFSNPSQIVRMMAEQAIILQPTQARYWFNELVRKAYQGLGKETLIQGNQVFLPALDFKEFESLGIGVTEQDLVDINSSVNPDYRIQVTDNISRFDGMVNVTFDRTLLPALSRVVSKNYPESNFKSITLLIERTAGANGEPDTYTARQYNFETGVFTDFDKNNPIDLTKFRLAIDGHGMMNSPDLFSNDSGGNSYTPQQVVRGLLDSGVIKAGTDQNQSKIGRIRLMQCYGGNSDSTPSGNTSTEMGTVILRELARNNIDVLDGVSYMRAVRMGMIYSSTLPWMPETGFDYLKENKYVLRAERDPVTNRMIVDQQTGNVRLLAPEVAIPSDSDAHSFLAAELTYRNRLTPEMIGEGMGISRIIYMNGNQQQVDSSGTPLPVNDPNLLSSGALAYHLSRYSGVEGRFRVLEVINDDSSINYLDIKEDAYASDLIEIRMRLQQYRHALFKAGILDVDDSSVFSNLDIYNRQPPDQIPDTSSTTQTQIDTALSTNAQARDQIDRVNKIIKITKLDIAEGVLGAVFMVMSAFGIVNASRNLARLKGQAQSTERDIAIATLSLELGNNVYGLVNGGLEIAALVARGVSTASTALKLASVVLKISIVGSAIAIATAGVQIGIAIHDIANAQTETERVSAGLAILDAGIQIIIQVVSIAVSFIPVVGQALSFAINIVSLFVPSAQAIYNAVTLSQKVNELMAMELTYDAMVLRASSLIAEFDAIPGTGIIPGVRESYVAKRTNEVLVAMTNDWFVNAAYSRSLYSVKQTNPDSDDARSVEQMVIDMGQSSTTIDNVTMLISNTMALEYTVYETAAPYYKVQNAIQVEWDRNFPNAMATDGTATTQQYAIGVARASQGKAAVLTALTQTVSFSGGEGRTRLVMMLATGDNRDNYIINAQDTLGTWVYSLASAGGAVTINAGLGTNSFQLARNSLLYSDGRARINIFTATDALNKNNRVLIDGVAGDTNKKINLNKLGTSQVFGASDGLDIVTGSLDNQVYFARSDGNTVTLSGNAAVVSVGPKARINIQGLSAQVWLDMDLYRESATHGVSTVANWTAPVADFSLYSPTIQANYGGYLDASGKALGSVLNLQPTDNSSDVLVGKTTVVVDAHTTASGEDANFFNITYVADGAGGISKVQAQGFNQMVGVNKGSETIVVRDQSKVDANKRLTSLGMGDAAKADLYVYDTSGSLSVSLGTGANTVYMGEGAKIGLATTKKSSSQMRDVINLANYSTVTAYFQGTEIIHAESAKSNLYASIGAGLHNIYLGGQSAGFDIETDVVSQTHIYSSYTAYDALSMQSLNFVGIDSSHLYISLQSNAVGKIGQIEIATWSWIADETSSEQATPSGSYRWGSVLDYVGDPYATYLSCSNSNTSGNSQSSGSGTTQFNLSSLVSAMALDLSGNGADANILAAASRTLNGQSLYPLSTILTCAAQ